MNFRSTPLWKYRDQDFSFPVRPHFDLFTHFLSPTYNRSDWVQGELAWVSTTDAGSPAHQTEQCHRLKFCWAQRSSGVRRHPISSIKWVCCPFIGFFIFPHLFPRCFRSPPPQTCSTDYNWGWILCHFGDSNSHCWQRTLLLFLPPFTFFFGWRRDTYRPQF